MTKFKQALKDAVDSYDPYFWFTHDKETINKETSETLAILPKSVRTQKQLNDFMNEQLESVAVSY